MKRVQDKLIVTCAIVTIFFLTLAAGSGFSQVLSEKQKNGLEVLRDKSLRTKEPEKVLAAIRDVTTPFIARPAGPTTEPIPTEVLTALADLLDFGQINTGDPHFDVMAGQMVYPVMGILTYLRDPVLPTMVEVLENEDIVSVKSQNAVWVIRRVLDDDVTAFNFLRVEAEGVKSKKGKERLLSTANRLLLPGEPKSNR